MCIYCVYLYRQNYRVVKGGGSKGRGFPKVPQSSLGILRVPQLPPLEHPPLRNPTTEYTEIHCRLSLLVVCQVVF